MKVPPEIVILPAWFVIFAVPLKLVVDKVYLLASAPLNPKLLHVTALLVPTFLLLNVQVLVTVTVSPDIVPLGLTVQLAELLPS